MQNAFVVNSIALLEVQMTTDQARQWIIFASILITGVQLTFFLTAPAIGYPLTYPKNISILQMTAPVFFGYLGAASHFAFANPASNATAPNQFLGILVRGPIVVYSLVIAAVTAAFGYSNRVGASIGDGMSVDDLANSLSIALGLLAASTSVITSYLFVPREPD